MADRIPLAVKVNRSPEGAVVLAPSGDIGYHEAPTLQQAVREAFDGRSRRVVIDLTGVPYMATPGLAALVQALQMSKRDRVPLVLCGLSERVRAVFEIAKLHSVFTIVTDSSAAMST